MVYLWQYIMVLFQWPSWSALLCRPCRIYIKRAREAEEEEKEEDRQPSASAKVCLPRVLFFARWPSKTSPPVCHPIILNMITNLEACGRNTTSYKDSYMNTSYLFYQCNIIMTYKDIYIYGCLVFMWHFWHDQGLVFMGFLGMKHATIWFPMRLDGWYIYIYIIYV
jgi:hypothetical protein